MSAKRNKTKRKEGVEEKAAQNGGNGRYLYVFTAGNVKQQGFVTFSAKMQLSLTLDTDIFTDAARTCLQVYDDNHQLVQSVYPLNNSFTFSCSLPHLSNYTLSLQSLDITFPLSNQFILSAINSTTYSLQQHVSGIHSSLTSQLPLIYFDVKNSDAVSNVLLPMEQFRFNKYTLQSFKDPESSISTLLYSIPGLSMVLKSWWMSVLLAFALFVALFPLLIPYIDPDFGDRMLQAQMDAKQQQEQENKAKKDA